MKKHSYSIEILLITLFVLKGSTSPTYSSLYVGLVDHRDNRTTKL